MIVGGDELLPGRRVDDGGEDWIVTEGWVSMKLSRRDTASPAAPSGPDTPRLLVIAHGTASPAGRATVESLVDAIRATRPGTETALCFLDVIEPRLPDALDDRPTVAVPLLLSTGYHVQSDIPAAIAGYPNTRLARHLGPDPLLVDVLLDRLPKTSGADHQSSTVSTVLVGSGSSRPEAAIELATTAALLGDRLGEVVGVLTMGDDLLGALAALPQPVRVATYLLAEGYFVRTLRESVRDPALVAPPLGVHTALVELVWARYDAAAADGSATVRGESEA